MTTIACGNRLEDARTFLHFIGESSPSLDVVREAVQYGVKLETLDVEGWTALHAAVNRRRNDIVLLMFGKDSKLCEIADADGVRPIHLVETLADLDELFALRRTSRGNLQHPSFTVVPSS